MSEIFGDQARQLLEEWHDAKPDLREWTVHRCHEPHGIVILLREGDIAAHAVTIPTSVLLSCKQIDTFLVEEVQSAILKLEEVVAQREVPTNA